VNIPFMEHSAPKAQKQYREHLNGGFTLKTRALASATFALAGLLLIAQPAAADKLAGLCAEAFEDSAEAAALVRGEAALDDAPPS
jgi:hypothetical protein